MSDPVKYYKKPSNIPSASELPGQIVPALAGAGNQLLFGLPEAAVKGIGGEKVRQMVDEYKAKNQGYGAGEIAGGIGSMFIPAGLAFKGLGALGKGAEVALGGSNILAKTAGGAGRALTKLGEKAVGPAGLAQGLAAGAEQGALRAAAEYVDTGDLEKTGKEMLSGLAFGGAVGGGLSLAKKGLERLPKRMMEEVEEATNNQILTDIFGKSMGRAIRGTVGTKVGASGQIEKIDNLKNDMVNLLDKHGIKHQQQVEDLLSENGGAWKKLSDMTNDAVATGKMQNLAEKPDDMFEHPDVQNVLAIYGDDAKPILEKILGSVKRNATDPANTFVKTREALSTYITNGFKGGSTEQVIGGDVAQALKNYFEQKAMSLIPEGAKELTALKY